MEVCCVLFVTVMVPPVNQPMRHGIPHYAGTMPGNRVGSRSRRKRTNTGLPNLRIVSYTEQVQGASEAVPCQEFHALNIAALPVFFLMGIYRLILDFRP